MVQPLFLTLIALFAQAGQDLIGQLQDPDPVVRLKAAKLLGQSGDKGKDALPALRKAASEDADEDVRLIAKQAIKKLVAAQAAPKNIEQLAQLITDIRVGNAATKTKALERLAALGRDAESASEAIIGTLMDKSPGIRERALNALEKANPTLSKPIVTLLVDTDGFNRREALEMIRSLGPRGRPVAPLFVQILKMEPSRANILSWGDKGLVMDCLEGCAPAMPEFCDALFDLIRPRRNQRGQVQFLAAHAELRNLTIELIFKKSQEGIIDKKRAVSAFVEAMVDAENLPTLVRACGKTGPEAKGALPALRKLKFHPDRDVREQVALAIEHIDIPAAPGN